MSTSTNYRYQFPAKAIKGDCPDCSPRHRKTLSRYIDTQTGDILPEEYGRCDREANCAYSLSPYSKGPSGMSYADEVYEHQKKNRGLLSIDRPRRPAFTPTAKPAPAIHTIPGEYLTRSLSHYEDNQFARLLVDHFGQQKAEQLLQQFNVGTSARWPGATVFWLVDEQDRVRGGQVSLFGPDWHRMKYTDRNGVERASIDWVHGILQRQYEWKQESVPQWLVEYGREGERSPCLFGLPQLKTIRPDQRIAIVEAPKTAIVCAGHMPEYVWMATMSKGSLTPNRLAPLMGRQITLFPDLNACYDFTNKQGKLVRGWDTIADRLRAQGFHVEVNYYLEMHATPEQKEKGLDLADFILADEVDKTAVGTPAPAPTNTSVSSPQQTFHQWTRTNWAFQQLGIRSAA